MDNEWSPSCVPAEWKFAGSAALADAVGFGRSPGAAAAASNAAGRPAYVWFPTAKSERRLSFAEAHASAADLAAHLRAAAVASNALAANDGTYTVGLILKRSAALPLAELACFKAGATFVPCDPQWPQSRVNDILSEANVCAVVRDRESDAASSLLADKAVAIVEVSDTAEVVRVLPSRSLGAATLATAHAEARDALAAPEGPSWAPPEVMYVMYTSGSTGKPKGCIVPTAGLWAHFRWAARVQKLTPDDVFVLKTTCTFDVSIHEMWVPLVQGCTSVVLADGLHLDFDATVATMTRGGVSFAHFVPSLLGLFLDYVKPGDIPTLRQIVCIGEALLLSHRTKLTKAFGRPVQLINMYGPTEASVVVTWFDAEDDAPGVTHGFPIGYAPADEVKLYITDPADPATLLPPGEKGEVCIGGVQVAYGYLGRKELTADKFVRNPHGHAGLLYRTGDLGSMRPDGCFEYNGRADRQVKIGGVRMELGEIEAVCLKLFPQLLNVAVEKVGNALVGVAAPVPGQELPAPGEVNLLLADRLPAAYVPSEWLFRDSLPLGSAGKVDHKRVVAWIEDQHKAVTWGSIYDEMYVADKFQVADIGEDPTMDWASYYDSFTGRMHERATIEEWVDVTVREVLDRQPASVIEQGCGKGMIMFRMASNPHVQRAVGADLSRVAVEHVERTWRSHFKDKPIGPAGLGKLSTYVRDASNYAGFADGQWDAVVCNGVSLYFPSVAYQAEVLANGLRKLAPGGCFHLGDVRSLAHQRHFCVRKARHIGGATFHQCADPTFQAEQMALDKDRSYDHRLFHALHLRGRLPGVAAVEVQLKRGAIMSEFTRYRYNVLLHTGVPAAPLAVQTLPAAVADQSALHIAAAIAAAGKEAQVVVAVHGIGNARLTADQLLVDGRADAAAPAVQRGVGQGGGVDPADLRAALGAALPAHHTVLTWARDGRADRMDCYAFPASDLLAGLSAVAAESVAECREELLLPDLDLEALSNKTDGVDKDAAGSREDAAAKAAAEAKKLWAAGDQRNAVLTIVASALGLAFGDAASLENGAPVLSEATTFADNGGNSFAAMGAVGALREALGVTAAVFELLTLPFGHFADTVVARADADTSDSHGWLVESMPRGGVFRSVSDRETPHLPTFVFFPMAGGSPKQYAHVYMALRRSVPHARCLFVQPPGRDARAAEASESDIDKYMQAITSALVPKLVGEQHIEGPVVFVGDSWGALAAYEAAHRLRRDVGFQPDRIVVSGNASPAIASNHKGLGCHSDTPMRNLTDTDLAEFLRASGVTEAADASDGSGLHATLAPLRADCQLYEDFKRPAHAARLSCNAVVLRGREDAVVQPSEMYGWADEFDGEEVSFVTVPNASHHIWTEQPQALARRLADLVKDEESHVSVQLSRVRNGASTHIWSKAGATPALEQILGPPCAFVKAVDLAELNNFREGYFRYRCGSPWGSRGELASLATDAC